MTVTSLRSKWIGMSVLLLMLASCGGGANYPQNVRLDGWQYDLINTWNREGVSAGVFVERGQTLTPSIPFQLNVFQSEEKGTAQQLSTWLAEQYRASGAQLAHDNATPEETCRAGTRGGRTFVSLQLCKDGSGRAACVEADQRVTPQTLTECEGDDECFKELCDLRWGERRKAMEKVATDTLAQIFR